LINLWEGKTGLQTIVGNIVLPVAKKIELTTLVLQSVTLLPQTRAFFARLVSKGDAKYLRQIYNAYSDAISVVVPGALSVAGDYGVKLLKGSSFLRRAIRSQIKPGQTAAISIKIDPSIIGGFTIRVGNAVLDESLKPRLDKIYSQFTNKIAQAASKDKDTFMKLPIIIPFAGKDRFASPEIPKLEYTQKKKQKTKTKNLPKSW